MSKNVIIDGIEYSPVQESDEELRIVIVDNRGLTFIGMVNIYQPMGTIVTIRNARCIIQWGTTDHIAELIDGPTSSTKLGAEGDVQFLMDNMIVSYRCGGAWK